MAFMDLLAHNSLSAKVNQLASRFASRGVTLGQWRIQNLLSYPEKLVSTEVRAAAGITEGHALACAAVAGLLAAPHAQVSRRLELITEIVSQAGDYLDAIFGQRYRADEWHIEPTYTAGRVTFLKSLRGKNHFGGDHEGPGEAR